MPGELIERIQATLDDLDAAKTALETHRLGEISKRVRDDFGDRIKKMRIEIGRDLKRAKAATCEASEVWSGFEQNREACSRLMLECLAFVQGALIREQALDGGLCQVADAMIAELNEAARLTWKSFTLISDSESFADLAEIIRLRFPPRGIWDLPILAHEFGHFASKKLRVRNGATSQYDSFDNFVGDKAKEHASDNGWSFPREHLEEFFADAFGTFSLGPAFVRTCLFIRFNPGTADLKTNDHPSSTSRAYLILEVLRQMEKTYAEYSAVRKGSQDAWALALAETGKQAIKKDDPLDEIARDLYRFLKDAAPHAEYKSWPSAQALSTRLLGNNTVDKETTFADVLNAAWYRRLAGLPPATVSERAMVMFGKLMSRAATAAVN